MKIVIVGGGSVGYYLAKTLLEHHHEPSLVEQDKNACARIANELDIPVICSDGTTIDALRDAGADNADALIAATGKDENNLIACQLAKMEFHIKRTVAKANNPKNVEVMNTLGVDTTVSSIDYISRIIEREVDLSSIKQLISLNQGEASISEILLPDDFKYSGKQLTDIKLPDQSVVVSVQRGGEILIPRGNTHIYAGDKLLIMAKTSALHAVKEKLKLTD